MVDEGRREVPIHREIASVARPHTNYSAENISKGSSASMVSSTREDEGLETGRIGSTSSSVVLIHFQKSRLKLVWTSASSSRTSDGKGTGATKAASCVSIAEPESGFGESSVASVGVLSRDELSDVVAVVDALNVNSVAGTSASEAEAELLKCWQAFEYDSGKPPAATSSFPQYLFQWVLPYLRRVKLVAQRGHSCGFGLPRSCSAV